ncbi:hypothetical protein F503_06214 [Ophiostoma piceae UAMH 11346]|uniref:Uncharacterized protein n=1 Tax=Ophiostoma piceae (strain UAMH 11346) TaxID=1262450 RepID=S3CV82_OPHP1|nr:hypothetical protein F503_06214 [Ophiostoma piceae UAMH 11346]
MGASCLDGLNVPVYSADTVNRETRRADAVHQVPDRQGGAVFKSQVAYKAPTAGPPAQNSNPTRAREPPQSPTENVAMSRERRSKTRRSRGGSQSRSARKRKRTNPTTDVAL